MEWSLKELYDGFDSPEFKSDMKNIKTEIDKIVKWSRLNLKDDSDAGAKLETFISMKNNFAKYYNPRSYAFLVAQAHAEDQDALKNMGLCEELYAELVPADFLFKKFVLDWAINLKV